MWRHDPRTLVLRALLLDWLGQLLIFAGISISSRWIVPMAGLPLFESQGLWLIYCLLLYPLLGWLFGSFTVLSWRRLAFPVLLQRLLITAMVTFVVVAISLVVNPSEELWLVFRSAGSLAWSTHDLVTADTNGIAPVCSRPMSLPDVLQGWKTGGHAWPGWCLVSA